MRRITISIIELAVAYALIYIAVAGQIVRGSDEIGESIPPANQSSTDPTGFTEALNGLRAQRGLRPVAYDPRITAHAERNNQLQRSYGLGHHWLGGLAQCVGVGMFDMGSVLRAWTMSPGHAAILFDPSLTSVGYHQLGTCHTASCSTGGVLMPSPQSDDRRVGLQSSIPQPQAFAPMRSYGSTPCYGRKSCGFFRRCR